MYLRARARRWGVAPSMNGLILVPSQRDPVYPTFTRILIESAFPPALCGIAAVVAYYGTQFVKQPNPPSSTLHPFPFRIFATLWLGSNVYPFPTYFTIC